MLKMKQKNLITVVTDHQFTADTIARAIGANEKHDGYYLGNGYAVTWTNGTVIEATFSPTESFVLSTTMAPRLVYAHNFKFSMRDYDALVGYKKSEQDARQLETIKALWRMSSVVVNAMSPDIDGDLDFLNLYYYLALPTEIRRAWLPILTKGAIRHGVMYGPTNRKEYDTWLEESIFNLLVESSKDSASLKGAYIVEEMTTEVANDTEMIQNSCPEDGSCIYGYHYIAKISDYQTLYNLNGLLVDAATELDFDHEKTIRTAYNLYAKKLISYPMVTQNTIPQGIWKLMCRNMEILRFNGKWGHTISKGRPSRRHNFRLQENLYNGHGIVTTGLHPTDLSRDEERLYNLIVKRVIESFAPTSDEKKACKKWHRTRNSKVKTA